MHEKYDTLALKPLKWNVLTNGADLRAGGESNVLNFGCTNMDSASHNRLLISRPLYTLFIDQKGISIMNLKKRWVEILYNVATRSRKMRNFFTPIGAIFYALLTFSFVVPELLKRLGEDYIEYRKRTPMFFPGLGVIFKKRK